VGKLVMKEPAAATKNPALTAKVNMMRLHENARNGSLKKGAADKSGARYLVSRCQKGFPF